MNVLFIPVDDLRPQLGCYGQTQIVSPNIDRLAETGTLFDRAYCQQAVCAPSRASFMSGCRPDTTTIYDLRTPLRSVMPDVVTLPQHFKNSGYEVVSLGKVYHHFGKDDPQGWSLPEWRGDDGTIGRGYHSKETRALCERRQAEARRLLEENPDRKNADMLRKDASNPRGPAIECLDLPDNAYKDGMNADKAIEELRRLKDKPFFLAVGFHKPHLPFVAPKKYWDLYKREDIDLADNPFAPKDAPKIALSDWGELRAYMGIPQEGPLSDEQARELIHGYYACVSYLDAQVGRVLDELDRLGLADDTAVVLWGDHGWKLGEHGMWCKHTNFEIDCHSPLIARAPGRLGGPTRALVEFVDVYPTLCELCGLPLPDHLEGTSFVPLLDDPGREWKPAAFSQYPRRDAGGAIMGYTLRSDRYRYTEWKYVDLCETMARELYDHEKDGAENANVVDDPEYAAAVSELADMMETGWQGARPASL